MTYDFKNKKTLTAFAEKMEACLKAGFPDVDIRGGNISYEPTGNGFNIKITVSNKGVNLEHEKEAEALRQCAGLYDLDLTKEHDGMKLVGLKSRGNKPFVLLRATDNARLVIDEKTAHRFFGLAKAVQS